MDIRKLAEAGHAALAAKHAEKEEGVRGHPRVGSIGIVADGEVFGVCHRIAHARQIGIEKPADLSTDVMWKAGEANEWHWERILAAAGAKVLRHDEVLVRATIPGVPLEVLGHPDIVLADDAGAPVMGIELKGIFGATMAKQVFIQHRPKNENLIQAAGYSYFKQLPYSLVYTLSSWVKLYPNEAKQFGAPHIRPGYYIFHMEWRDDVMWYRPEQQDEWIRTNITPQAIESYYQLLEEMKQAKELGPRPTAKYVGGGESKWDACGLCEFKSACDRHDSDGDYENWLNNIIKREVSE